METNFPERFVDFKNIECLIEELHNLYKETSKDDKIGPFNPNLPVLNISKCDDTVRTKSKSKDIFKTKSSTRSSRRKENKKSRSRTQIEIKPKGNESITPLNISCDKDSICCAPRNPIKSTLTDDCDDDIGKSIVESIENLLIDDTFSPRYKAKHASDMFLIFRKSIRRNDSTSMIFNMLEKEAIEQYDNIDDVDDMNFNIL